MEAPKELYIQRYSYGALVPGYADKPVKMADGENIKYIRADLAVEKEKLIERLEEIKKAEYENCGGVNAKTGVLQEVQELISTLQQEQPEPSNNLVDVDAVRDDFITEVYRVLDADPTNDRANAIIDAFDSLPTVSQEQPEMDLEKEFNDFLNNVEGVPRMWHSDEQIEWAKHIARHFAEWGAIHLNARK